MEADKFFVEVAYANPEKQLVLSVEADRNTSIETVIDRSGILEHFPEIDLMQQKVGVFSKIKKLTDTVQKGDRVEIYRPLTMDPKEARRLRELKRKL